MCQKRRWILGIRELDRLEESYRKRRILLHNPLFIFINFIPKIIDKLIDFFFFFTTIWLERNEMKGCKDVVEF